VLFEPMDFIARLAPLVPKPRAHLTRYHGVFASASAWRARVVAKGRTASTDRSPQTPTDQHRAMTSAQRLKRVVMIDIETCRRCGGKLRLMASIEEPAVVERILNHLGRMSEPLDRARAPSAAPV
jgi:hypothetical protein